MAAAKGTKCPHCGMKMKAGAKSCPHCKKKVT